MIYVLSRHSDYDYGEVVHVSESLLTCINVINNNPSFPCLGDRLEFAVWDNDKKIATSTIPGYRVSESDDVVDLPVTYIEVIDNMKPVEQL